jgi:hypothetical protein
MEFNMKHLCTIILGSVLFLTHFNALAEGEIYVGAAAGFSIFDYDDVDPGTATKLFIGYNVKEDIIIEAGLYDSGDADITSAPGFALNVEGINVKVLYVTPATGNQMRVMVGAGFYNFDSAITFQGFELISESSSGLSLHGGIQIPINEAISLRGDADAFVGVEDFDQDNTIISLHAGIVLSF